MTINFFSFGKHTFVLKLYRSRSKKFTLGGSTLQCLSRSFFGFFAMFVELIRRLNNIVLIRVSKKKI